MTVSPFSSVQFSCSVLSKSLDPMDCSAPGLPVHHKLPEFLKLMSTEAVKPSNHRILCHPLLTPSIFLSIRVFSNDSVLRIRCPKFWNLSFSISPSNKYSRWTGWISLQYKGLSRVFSTPQFNSITFFVSQLSL